MKKTVKTITTLVLRVGVSLLSLGALLYVARGRLTEALHYLIHLNVFPFLLAIVINFVSIAVVAVRIGTILSIQGIRLPFWRRYYLWLVSLFFSLFLPSAVGGDIAKAYYIYKDSGKKLASATSVLLDRFFGLLATVSIGFVAYLIARKHINDPRIGHVLIAVTVIIVFGMLFMMSRRFSKPTKSLLLKLSPKPAKELLSKLFEALDLYRNRRLDFFCSYGLSLLAQFCFILMVYLLGESIGIDLPVTLFLLFMPIITVVSLVPSIGGLGVREATTVYLFKGYLDLELAIALSLVFDVFLYGIGGICGILYAIRGGASIKEVEKLEEESLKKEYERYQS